MLANFVVWTLLLLLLGAINGATPSMPRKALSVVMLVLLLAVGATINILLGTVLLATLVLYLCVFVAQKTRFWWRLTAMLVVVGPIRLGANEVPEGQTFYWLWDAFNKSIEWLARRHDIVLSTPTVEQIEAALLPNFVSLAADWNQLEKLFLALNLLLAWWLAAQLSSRVPPMPRIERWRMPPMVLPLIWLTDGDVIRRLGASEALEAGFILAGAAQLWVLLSRQSVVLRILVGVLVLALRTDALWLLFAIGVIDSFFGLRQLLLLDATPPRRHTMGAYFGGNRLGVLIVMALMIAVTLSGWSWMNHAATRSWLETTVFQLKHAGEATTTTQLDEVRVDMPEGNHFYIDRWEYPNEASATPVTDLSWEDAARFCGYRGKRLCTVHEWVLACGGTSYPNFAYAGGPSETRQRCNADKLYRDDAGIVPSGQSSQCVTSDGVMDQVGNVWEMLADTKPHGVRMIAGGSYAMSDDLALSCRGVYFVRPSQLQTLQPNHIGFRCCRSD